MRHGTLSYNLHSAILKIFITVFMGLHCFANIQTSLHFWPEDQSRKANFPETNLWCSGA